MYLPFLFSTFILTDDMAKNARYVLNRQSHCVNQYVTDIDKIVYLFYLHPDRHWSMFQISFFVYPVYQDAIGLYFLLGHNLNKNNRILKSK
jgi:hypothetical protein